MPNESRYKKETAYDAGSESHVAKKKTKVSLIKQQAEEDMKQMLSEAYGRRLLWRMLEKCGIYKTSFTGNSTTFFNEGRRAVGLDLLEDIIKVSPSSYTLMQSENLTKKDTR
tara:strand:+ start:606 stop:941 length:336 start_codon:yes stop_codon:yes gene_type:complete